MNNSAHGDHFDVTMLFPNVNLFTSFGINRLRVTLFYEFVSGSAFDIALSANYGSGGNPAITPATVTHTADGGFEPFTGVFEFPVLYTTANSA